MILIRLDGWKRKGRKGQSNKDIVLLKRKGRGADAWIEGGSKFCFRGKETEGMEKEIVLFKRTGGGMDG